MRQNNQSDQSVLDDTDFGGWKWEKSIFDDIIWMILLLKIFYYCDVIVWCHNVTHGWVIWGDWVQYAKFSYKQEKRIPTTPPTKALLTSPLEKWSPQRSVGNSERKSSMARPLPVKSTPNASDVPDSVPVSPSKRKPPRLDLSSLQNDPPLDSTRRSGQSTGSPSTGRAIKKGLDSSPATPQDMKKGTMVFVVRSPSEGGSPARIQVKQQVWM